MNRYFILLLAALVSISCAPSIKRIGYREKPTDIIQTIPKITYNRTGLDGNSKIGTMIIYNNCSDSESAMDIIIPEGAFIGARAANLYNIKQSTFMFGSYRTYVDFYSDSISDVSSKDIFQDNNDNFIDSIHNRGFQVHIEEYLGFICGGKQGQKQALDKRGFGIGCVCMINESFGLNTKYDFIGTGWYENVSGGVALIGFGETIFYLGTKYDIIKRHC
jgi:hypothetical protein